MVKEITIKGARENNLKNIDLEIPRDSLVVITGLSGSGKSSLAFDTIYAEGRRRYVESLSAYARMFIGQMRKPDVDYIEGLSPAVSIDQKTTSANPRSTVGTVTEIYDYLRLLWARIGVPHCPRCGKEIKRQTIDQIVDRILALPADSRIQILAPVIRGKKGEHKQVIEDARKSGYVRLRIDGSVYDINEEIPLNKNTRHDISIIVDRLVIREGINRRLTDSVETALNLAEGIVYVDLPESGENLIFSQNFACEDCGISLEEITPAMFSFNNPAGACPKCSGLGVQLLIDPDLITPNKELSINDGGIVASGWGNIKNNSISKMYFDALAKRFRFKLSDPIRDLPEDAVNAILYGTGGEKLKLKYETADGFGVINREFEGIINNLNRRYSETQSQSIREEIEECMSETACPECSGKRLKSVALAVTVFGKSIYDFSAMPVAEAYDYICGAKISEKEHLIADRIIREIKDRLLFLKNVGLGYLTLARAAATLSGGESQRIRLATQIGSGLTGVLYILDEPSIGLHQADNRKLLKTLKNLRDQGNSLIVVEHDEETMMNADYIVDMGPGAGSEGGNVVCAGTPEEIRGCADSITGKYLRGDLSIPVPSTRRTGNGRAIVIRGAAENNLKNIDVAFPLGKLVCVTGVSGSGKSSLVNEILYKILAGQKNHAKIRPGKFDSVEGLEYVDKVIVLDQSPIGRTPRSNPATYTGLFSDIRELFASTNDAKMRGFGAGRFSFNVAGGRCEACKGDGLVKIEMNFLPDVFVPCEVCHGKRYNRETLEVRYKNKNISDILDMTVSEALSFFSNHKRILQKVRTLYDVGLGYIKLGQSSTTLSGGEAQRVKLATELSRPDTGSTVYILDEPTTGLHSDDVNRLVSILDRLVNSNNTVIVIEHNLDVIKVADHIIDLGPEGGDRGGNIVFTGTPEECAGCKESYTGQFLKKVLKK